MSQAAAKPALVTTEAKRAEELRGDERRGDERRGDERRQKLLQAAARCFITSGFHGARMAQIAKEAQMSPGLIYHYFDSKEDIIAAMVRAHADEKRCMVDSLEAAGPHVIDQLLDNMAESVESTTDPFWSALMLEMTAEATRSPQIAETLRAVDAEIKERVLASLAQGVDGEEIDTRLELFVAMLQGVGIRNILNPALDKAAAIRLMKDVVGVLFPKKSGPA